MEREKSTFEKLADVDFSDRSQLFQPLESTSVHMWIDILGRGWELVDGGKAIEKIWRFPSYQEGVEMTLQLADLAEELNHHPDIGLGFKKVIVRLTTHNVGRLTLGDFAMAARIESVLLTKRPAVKRGH